MSRVLKSPGRYIQGPGELFRLGEHLQHMGNRPLILISKGGMERFSSGIKESLAQKGMSGFFEIFAGECLEEEILRLTESAKKQGCDIIAGVGGGKIADTAKAVGEFAELPTAVVPTTASTDAPCSALSLVYDRQGEFKKYIFLKENPRMVLVDTEVILQAGSRFLTAGMGDAAATYYEARAVQRSGSHNQAGGKPPMAAFCLAETAKDILMRDGAAAKKAAENKSRTTAFENVVEANIYLSGVGFESGGIAAAHSIQKGFTCFPQFKGALHGEAVAFCTLVQLILEDSPEEELSGFLHFLRSVGLPVTLEELGMAEPDDKILEYIARYSVQPEMNIHKLPFEIQWTDIFCALKMADALGKNAANSEKIAANQ